MPILLGVIDKDVKSYETDWSTNKIGGKPDFMNSNDYETYLECKVCQSSLHLLAQIYCPLVDSLYHRTLFIFGCTSRTCWNNVKSITVLRSQLVEKQSLESESEDAKISNDDWGMNDWADDDDWSGKGAESSKVDVVKTDDSITAVTEQFDSKLSIKETLKDHPSFAGYFIYVLNEDETVQSTPTQYEKQLYEDYIQREGELVIENVKSISGGAGKNTEKYEKTNVKHGDQLFYHFKKRIENCPEQLLRYEFNGNPLYLSSLSKPIPDIIPNCEHCGGARVFELQLMPNLVTCLQEDDVNQYRNCSQNDKTKTESCRKRTESGRYEFSDDDSKRIEFGCIYVYTCKNSCWNQNDTIHTEIAVVQADPDINVLK